jgi:hypothetical protein
MTVIEIRPHRRGWKATALHLGTMIVFLQKRPNPIDEAPMRVVNRGTGVVCFSPF